MCGMKSALTRAPLISRRLTHGHEIKYNWEHKTFEKAFHKSSEGSCIQTHSITLLGENLGRRKTEIGFYTKEKTKCFSLNVLLSRQLFPFGSSNCCGREQHWSSDRKL